MLEVRVTMINKYMWYGGTNWGLTAAPVVYTSYGPFTRSVPSETGSVLTHSLFQTTERTSPRNDA
jgi:hypothetical protein